MTLELDDLYRDLHRHPELAFQETRTAGIVAESLASLGYEVVTGLGGTGVVGVLRNGDGPTVLLRADMDALPVREETGLPYASTATGVTADGRDVPLMHACGHDMHVTCLLGAAERLSADLASWSGTLEVLFQPAEEAGGGADAMLADGLYERIPRPEVVLGQHVSPLPAGVVGLHPGVAMAAADSLAITVHGRGGHGSRPETTIDPIVLAASIVLRLQTIVSREIAAGDAAVVTVGQVHAGTKSNIIPATATLGLSLRSFSPEMRERLLAAVERIVNAEAQASGAERMPDIVREEGFGVTHNEEAASARVVGALTARLGEGRVIDHGRLTGSEDVGRLAEALDVPLVYWFLGGGDPEAFARATAAGTLDRDIPSNHSPFFAPLMHPTIEAGVEALDAAAREWLA